MPLDSSLRPGKPARAVPRRERGSFCFSHSLLSSRRGQGPRKSPAAAAESLYPRKRRADFLSYAPYTLPRTWVYKILTKILGFKGILGMLACLLFFGWRYRLGSKRDS